MRRAQKQQAAVRQRYTGIVAGIEKETFHCLSSDQASHRIAYKDNGSGGSDRVFTGIPDRGEKVLSPVLHMVHRLSFKEPGVVSKAHNSCTFEGRNCGKEVA